MKFIVEWQSNYNGVSIRCDVDYDKLTDEEFDMIEAVSDEAANTLPSYTYEVASKWDNLGNDEIAELKRRALAIIHKQYPDATIDDLSYQEDSRST